MDARPAPRTQTSSSWLPVPRRASFSGATGPVARSSDATSTPCAVRLLGEDLVLYRDGRGVTSLLTPRCCHRGTTFDEADAVQTLIAGNYIVDERCTEPASTSTQDVGVVRR